MFGEWVKWCGGKRPNIEGLRCDIKFRNGVTLENENSDDWDWDWEHKNHPHDIVYYRVKSDGE